MHLNNASTNHPFADNAKGWFFMFAKECAEEFRVECELRRLSKRTIKGYCNNTMLFLNYVEKQCQITQLEEVKSQHLKKYMSYLLPKNLTASYINGILKCLRAFLSMQ